MNFSIVYDKKKANVITHAGIFHADEIFATVILSKIMDIKLLRTYKVDRDDPEINKETIIYDLGGEYDPERLIFDHHQLEKEYRDPYNKLPLASAGLIWKHYGRAAISNMGIADQDAIEFIFGDMDASLFRGIDAADNGVNPADDMIYNPFTISGIISSCNATWDFEGDPSDKFFEAFVLANNIFTRLIHNSHSKYSAKAIVEVAIEKANGHVMILERYVPWSCSLLSSTNPKANDIWYVIFPSIRGGFNVQCVPVKSGSFEQRHPVPAHWRMNPEGTLVPGVTFVHSSGFLMATETLESAIELANRAVNSDI